MTEHSTPHRAFYERRIARVLAYIGEHLTEELSVERLSDVAGFSKFHFHRQFTAFTGVSVARAISLMRLKHASMQLAFDDGRSITDVAFDAGFETPESFSRAFKKLQGQSPSEFRSAPEWETWVDIFRTNLHTHQENMEPQIVTLPETRIAVLEHRGAPQDLMKSVQRFIEWRKSCDVSPNATSRTYGIAYDDPDATEPATFRFDICGSISDSYGALPKNDFGIVEKSIPKGRYVVARHLGSTDVIGKTVYGEWIPKSGEELRDFPCFFHYIDRMPTVSEHEQVTDVYLPLK